MPTVESGLAAVITKFGWLKLATLGAALGGAAIMACFRPPKTRKEVASHAFVALASSLIFGNAVYAITQNLTFLADVDRTAVHGMVGAMSWGMWAGVATWRDKFATNPVEAVKDVRSI